MDKATLVKRLQQTFTELERAGTPIQSVYLIPPQLLFKAKSFILVIASPVFEGLTVLEKTKEVRKLLSPDWMTKLAGTLI